MQTRVKVYLDMDGTIADLYNVNGWLDSLRNEKENLFLNLKPLTTQEILFKIFPIERYEIIILSMTPKNASQEYCTRVEQEKNEWLDNHFPKLEKRIYKKYGNNKNLKNSKNAILIDDNKTIRENFRGLAINPSLLW